LHATGAQISGAINADGGKIGRWTIDDSGFAEASHRDHFIRTEGGALSEYVVIFFSGFEINASGINLG
jgi:hypothetical protein